MKILLTVFFCMNTFVINASAQTNPSKPGVTPLDQPSQTRLKFLQLESSQTIIKGIGQSIDSRPRLTYLALKLQELMPYVRGWARPILQDYIDECYRVSRSFSDESAVSINAITETFELYWRFKNSQSFFLEAMHEINIETFAEISSQMNDLANIHAFYQRSRPQMIHANMHALGHLLDGVKQNTTDPTLRNQIVEILALVAECDVESLSGDTKRAWKQADVIYLKLKDLLPTLLQNRSSLAFGRAKQILALNVEYGALSRVWENEVKSIDSTGGGP